jgi:hypothetical protein
MVIIFLKHQILIIESFASHHSYPYVTNINENKKNEEFLNPFKTRRV